MIHEPEILEQILFHLPAKCCARFRCVSKSWNSLLSQPQFIRTHHRLHRINQYPIQEQSLILASHDSYSLFSVNVNLKSESAHQVFDEMPKPKPPLLPTELNLGDNHRFTREQILDKLTSCDGLIVVEDTNRNLVLINPTTRELKQLPETPNDRHRSGWKTKYGIGYDSFTDDYKVVTITYKIGLFWDWRGSEDEDDYERVNVYSVKNGTWKVVDNSPHYHGDCHCVGGVYSNGNIHWIARDSCDWWNVIAAFDLEDEEFWELPIPKWVEAKNLEYWEERCDSDDIDLTFAHFVIVDGCLCLAPSWRRRSYEYVCYVMREYNVKDSWIEITVLDHDMFGVRPLCFLGEEQMVLLMDEDGPCEKVVIYNLKQATFKDVEIQGFPDKLAIKGTFVQSLLSPLCVCKDEASNEE